MTQPIRFAFYGRVSTEDNQDPTLSLPRQLASCKEALPRVGGEIVAHFYDVESGASKLAQRGSGRGLEGFDIPIPRDGGLPELLEVSEGNGIDAVVCESINRISRNPAVTFQLEEELGEHDTRLWAIDEPWEESFGSIILRHVNVGVARGYLHELKVKSRQGLEAACRQGRHMGGISLYGYRFKEVEHPNPHRAKQGRAMLVLEPDPTCAPVVRAIFDWYVARGWSIREIVEKLNADLVRYPPPVPPDPKRASGEWSRSTVWDVLHNPKYTGYQVWNRRARSKGNSLNPPETWVWSESPAHEPLVSKEVFEKAALKGGVSNHNAGREGDGEGAQREVRPALMLRSFITCAICGLRMQGHRNRGSHYYACEAHRRKAKLLPSGHPKTVYLNETKAIEKVLEFLNTFVFGEDRRERVTELLDSEGPRDGFGEEIERLASELADLEAKIRRQLEHLDQEEASSPAAAPIRDRVRELSAQHEKKAKQLKAEEEKLSSLPSPESAVALLERLPVMEVHVERMGVEGVRDLLRVLNFQGAYDPRENVLNVAVQLIPELTLPEDPFTRVLSVPPTGNRKQPRRTLEAVAFG
ncbi:MAG: recombinase family protein [Actinobacteria bacterium]|nr:recombinase family protein [Actinomycetota bacterium]